MSVIASIASPTSQSPFFVPPANPGRSWDVGLAIDAIKLMNHLEVVVLVSGDGDYIPAVEYLQYNGTLVEVAAFGETASGKLKEIADDFIDISRHARKFLIH